MSTRLGARQVQGHNSWNKRAHHWVLGFLLCVLQTNVEPMAMFWSGKKVFLEF
jgi:hypothetical protein